MRSKYLDYKNGAIVLRLNNKCEGLLYDYFYDSHCGLVEWVAKTLNELLTTFRNVDYNKNCESIPFQEYKPNLQVGENLHPQSLIIKVEEVFNKNHDAKEIQSVLKCFDLIVEEMINSINGEVK